MILYAEDDIDDLEIFYEVLQSINPLVEIMNARNGAEVIAFLEKASRMPDYIFLDINMPAMDGKACLKNLKRDLQFSSIPVIVYTTSNDPRDKALCLELGAKDFIQKPGTVKEAIDKLAKFFQ